jgi:hypothetical protein
MGKKVKRKTYVSKGQRRSVANGVKEARRERPEFEKALNKLEAWRKGQNPWITVPGPASNRRFVRVRANNLWGDPKKISAGIFGKASADE